MIFLYHGSLSRFDRIDLSKCKDSRDFGRGFYLSPDKEHADTFAESRKRKMNRIYKRQNINREIIKYRYHFVFDDAGARKELNIRSFESVDDKWLRFVVKNRMSDHLRHNYDVVIGPTADAAAYSVISDAADDLIHSDYDKNLCDEIIRELHPERLSYQYCFCTNRSLTYLSDVKPGREIIK